MTTYGALLTTAGANKLAAAASGGPAVTLTQVAVGDANGTAYVPNQAQTALVDELYRATIASVGYVSPGTIEIVATIPANTNDGSGRASGGWQILEMGLFDSTGTLIAVANTPAIYKPLPSSCAAADLTVRMVLVIGTATSVAITVDSAHALTLDRLDRLPFIAVDSAVTTTPPSSPEVGATYLIPATGATGVWAGQGNKIAHWNGSAWVIVTPAVRTVVGVGDNRAYEEWNGTAWVPLNGMATGLLQARVAYYTAGTYSWTVPAGVTRIYAKVIGAGGSGGSGPSSYYGGSGGAGGIEEGWFTVTPGQVLAIQVGQGGAAIANSQGGSGTSSYITGLLSATSGTGGGGNGSGSLAGGVSGTGSVNSLGLGDGTSGGPVASGSYAPGIGGGPGGQAGAFTGYNAKGPGGGGGGGGYGYLSGAGHDGSVVIEY